MQWNAYLADAIAWLILVVPAALVALKLGYPQIRWWMILLAAAVLSWFFSVAYFRAFPMNIQGIRFSCPEADFALASEADTGNKNQKTAFA